VNTHSQYPVDVRHNAYYAADGADLRDATEEEREKYRLTAAHKKRKPEPVGGKSGSVTAAPDARKNDAAPLRRSNEGEQQGHATRDRDIEWRPRDKSSKDERERTSSRGSKNSRTTHTRDYSRDDATRKVSEGGDRGQSLEREKKSRTSNEDIDEDERYRRKMAEIVRRMEERAATKVSDVVRKTAADAKKPNRTPEVEGVKGPPKENVNGKPSTKTPIEIGGTLKKISEHSARRVGYSTTRCGDQMGVGRNSRYE